MEGSSQSKGDDLEQNPGNGRLSKPNSADAMKEQASDASVKSPKGMKVDQDGSKLKGKKKQGAKNDKKRLVDIDEYSLGGIKYKLPGKRQRIIVASVVLGLNILLVLAVILYFKNPDFQDFIYHVGRDV